MVDEFICHTTPFKQELEHDDSMTDYVQRAYITGFIQGAKWMQERMYSEEELEVAFFEGRENNLPFTEWFEQFKTNQNEQTNGS